MTDYLDTSIRRIWFFPAGYSLRPITVVDIVEKTQFIARLGSVSLDAEQLRLDAERVAHIQESLLRLTAEAFDGVNIADPALNRLFTIAQADEKWPQFVTWSRVLRVAGAQHFTEDYLMDKMLVVPFPDYMSKVDELMSSQSQRDLQNFLLWQFTNDVFLKKYVPDYMLEILPRDHACLIASYYYMSNAVGRIFIDYYYNRRPPIYRQELSLFRLTTAMTTISSGTIATSRKT